MIKRTGAASRMTAMAVVLGIVALTSNASPAAAQVLPADGMIWANAYCYMATNKADVSVTVVNPSRFSSSGLVYYVRVWAKGEWVTNWDLISQGQTGVVKTSTTTMWWDGPHTTNDPMPIFNTSFTGRYDGRYDIYVQYWYKTPTATSWAGSNGFAVSEDLDSQTNVVVSEGFGTYTHNYQTRVCTV